MLLPGSQFADCLHACWGGLAMAGTATEQLVGLGKPVFAVPGQGPQFNFRFAEAQQRLLGPSVSTLSRHWPGHLAENGAATRAGETSGSCSHLSFFSEGVNNIAYWACIGERSPGRRIPSCVHVVQAEPLAGCVTKIKVPSNDLDLL